MPETTPATTLEVRVDLPASGAARGYPILIGPGLLEAAGQWLAPHAPSRRVFVITDEGVAASQGHRLEAGLSAQGYTARTLVLPPGEGTKSFEGLARTLGWLVGQGCERGDLVVAFGGGVIGDLAGLAAGLTKRGVPFAQAPTTLLAQVDSSVGGKTAINIAEGKNLVGLFNQPVVVLADIDTLKTLPDRELAAGLAEVAKYGLIDQPVFFAWLEANAARLVAREPAALAHAIEVSCRAKAAVVARDETERGDRALLNLGHTFAHTLERAAGFSGRLLHGEAVGYGLALAMRYSARQGLATDADVARTERLLGALGLETRLSTLGDLGQDGAALADGMRHDKKVTAGRLTLILCRGIGAAFQAPGADLTDIARFLEQELGR
jgi:3-dehydroquinate synthase